MSRVWEELEHKAQRADDDAWGRLMPLWPEATGGDADPWFSHVYGMVMQRLGAHWLAANHPDPEVRGSILKLADQADPYHETRGVPRPPRMARDKPSVKDWRPSSRSFRGRVEEGVDRILALFFEGLADEYPGSMALPVPEAIVARYRPCVMSFLIHWLEYNYPDEDAVDAVKSHYIRQDPLFMDRCGAGGE